jgi:hypothetical protein
MKIDRYRIYHRLNHWLVFIGAIEPYDCECGQIKAVNRDA